MGTNPQSGQRAVHPIRAGYAHPQPLSLHERKDHRESKYRRLELIGGNAL